MFGGVVGMSDPAMGWSAYSQSMAVPNILSSLVLLRATGESIRLAVWLGKHWDDIDAGVALTDELLMPRTTRGNAQVPRSGCYHQNVSGIIKVVQRLWKPRRGSRLNLGTETRKACSVLHQSRGPKQNFVVGNL